MDRTRYLDIDEVSRLRTVTEAAAIKDMQVGRMRGVLAWAIVDTALSTGLRVSEIVSLHVGDFNARRKALRVTRRKRRRPVAETLALSPEFARHLTQFIAWKRDAGQPYHPDAALFIGKRGTLTKQGAQKIWRRAMAEAGLPGELSIHSARHTVAVHLLRKTRNLRHVQKQLGHTSPTVTAAMYADVPFDDMSEGVTGLYGAAL